MLRGAPPSEKSIFRKKIEIEFLPWEDASKSPLSEYIWVFEKRTDFDGLIDKKLSLVSCFSRNFRNFVFEVFQFWRDTLPFASTLNKRLFY